MGLAIEVGFLADQLEHDVEGADWFRSQMAIVNAKLTEAGLPAHIEPESLPALQSRAGLTSFPYSWLHHLRRIESNLVKDPQWPVTPSPDDQPGDDPAVRDEMFMMSSHLLCHSDAEGFYVPVAFDQLIFADDLAGGILCSSHRLQAELAAIAAPLGITLTDGALGDDMADRINAADESSSPLFREYAVWLTLWEACRLSIEHRTAIVFM